MTGFQHLISRYYDFRISFATKGSFDIVTTHDLRDFLAPVNLLNPHKSCRLYLEWPVVAVTDGGECTGYNYSRHTTSLFV